MSTPGDDWIDGEAMWPGREFRVEFKISGTDLVREGRCIGLRSEGLGGPVLKFESGSVTYEGRWWRMKE